MMTTNSDDDLNPKKPRSSGSKRRRAADGTLKQWSNHQKMEAAKMFVLSGSYTTASLALNIPYKTIRNWRVTKWWKDYVDEIKHEDTIELSAKLRKIAAKALNVTEDRLDNGNFQLDQKTGEVIRVPVSMKDAAKVANDLIVQQQKLEAKPETVASVENTVDARLAKLAEQFAMFSKVGSKPSGGFTKTIEVVDATETTTYSMVDKHKSEDVEGGADK